VRPLEQLEEMIASTRVVHSLKYKAAVKGPTAAGRVEKLTREGEVNEIV